MCIVMCINNVYCILYYCIIFVLYNSKHLTFIIFILFINKLMYFDYLQLKRVYNVYNVYIICQITLFFINNYDIFILFKNEWNFLDFIKSKKYIIYNICIKIDNKKKITLVTFTSVKLQFITKKIFHFIMHIIVNLLTIIRMIYDDMHYNLIFFVCVKNINLFLSCYYKCRHYFFD